MKLQPPDHSYPVSISNFVDEAAITRNMMQGADMALALRMALFGRRMQLLGYELKVTQIWRSTAKQAELYAKGRSTPGPRVTNAPPGTSPHECTTAGRPASQAFDIAPIIDGAIYWPTDAKSAPFWSAARDTGKMLDLKWGGDFKNPAGDFGHFQLSTFERVTT